jgi:lipoprotein-anchoring transpeptidase ErfK/SrfK
VKGTAARLALTVVAIGMVFALPACTSGGKAKTEASPAVRTAAVPSTTTTTAAPRIALAAVARVPSVAIYSGAGNLAPVRFLQNPTIEHIPLVFLAKARQGEWLYVQIPMRPNESMGWIRESDVNVSEVHSRIVVESAAHTLTVFQDDKPVFQAPVAVGTGGTPTPTGSFYIDAIVKLSRPDTVWGPYQLSVTGFSDVLKTFGGGQGQIAIHGTNAPGLIGGNVSHGCVRMQNPDITQVAALVGIATPVEIRA